MPAPKNPEKYKEWIKRLSETQKRIKLPQRFPKHHTPWNKGITTDCSHLKPHQFKSGFKPWNVGLTKEINSKLQGNTTMGRTVWNKNKKGLQVAWNKGKHHKPESNEKNRLAHLGKKATEETKQKHRLARSKYKLPLKDTSIERKLHQILDSLNIKYRKHFPIHHPKIGSHQVDIMFVDHEGNPKIAIECDGCYWHGCLKHKPNNKYAKKRQNRDRLIDKCLKELEIKLIRIWEHDINANRIPLDLYSLT